MRTVSGLPDIAQGPSDSSDLVAPVWDVLKDLQCAGAEHLASRTTLQRVEVDRDAWGAAPFSARSRPDGLDQLFAWDVLEQVAGRTGPDCLQDLTVGAGSRTAHGGVDGHRQSTYVDVISGGGPAMEVAIDAADSDDPRRGLRIAAETRRVAERQQDAAVRRARVAGMTWAEIATHLGVSKQAAHRKYRGRLAGRA
jgi:hypothetical protein